MGYCRYVDLEANANFNGWCGHIGFVIVAKLTAVSKRAKRVKKDTSSSLLFSNTLETMYRGPRFPVPRDPKKTLPTELKSSKTCPASVCVFLLTSPPCSGICWLALSMCSFVR